MDDAPKNVAASHWTGTNGGGQTAGLEFADQYPGAVALSCGKPQTRASRAADGLD